MAQSTSAPMMGFSNAAALNALGLGQTMSAPQQGGDDPGDRVQAYLASLLSGGPGPGSLAPAASGAPTAPAGPGAPTFGSTTTI